MISHDTRAARRSFAGVAALLILFGVSTSSQGQTAPGRTSAVIADGSVDTSAIPAWLAWRAFHDSLLYYGQRSRAVNTMLDEKFGLTAREIGALRNAGERFLQAMSRIDADARAMVQARYGSDRRPNAVRPPARPTLPDRERPIVLERGKTLREMVQASGLFDAIEEQKTAELTSHLADLERTIAPAKLRWIEDFVLREVASHVIVVDRGIPVGGIPPLETQGGYKKR